MSRRKITDEQAKEEIQLQPGELEILIQIKSWKEPYTASI